MSRKRIENFLSHPAAVGDDLLKKIIVYTLMMKETMPAGALFDYLMSTRWFVETVDLYFNGRYESKYDEIVNAFVHRGIVKQDNGNLYTSVKP